VDRFLGMLASTPRRFDEAEQFFQSALALEERIGSAPFVARTRYWYARTLLDRRSRGAPELAVEHLKTALEVASHLQMAMLRANEAGGTGGPMSPVQGCLRVDLCT
jgi:hypothetical protein